MLAAVILSAGESSRMGSPKALVPFRGRTFLEHLLDVVQQAKGQPDGQPSDGEARSQVARTGGGSVQGIGWTRVVLGVHGTEIREALRLDPATIVINPHWQQGQLSSIQAAVRSLPEGETDGMVLFLVDHPLIRAPLVDHLMEQFYNAVMTLPPIVLPTFHGRRGHPTIFPRRLYGELLAAPADKGARAIVWAHAEEVLEVPTEDEGILLNLNDPETLRRALVGLDQSSGDRS